MITPRTIQNVKDVVRIEEVLGDFIALKRKGPRYLGLCPFHNEKTPSFNVSPNLGIYKCFGCGESGDAITFLTKHEHLSYPEAIRWLAKRYQVDIEEEESSPEQVLEQSERESLSVIQQWALNWSVDQLWNTDEGKRIGHGYFRERGFTDATIKEFQLGYVPERGDAFAQAALANGFNPELLEKAGWIKRREDGTPWDFFQGRVTFPVQGVTGQPIAFGARTLRSDKKLPKYFNSPESVLYIKSRSLYGIFHAKKAIVEQGTCCLVEGYTDVISLHQAGIHNVVASSGTSLTEDQVRLIKRYAPSVTILYDGDNAGIKASLRGIDLILKEGLNVKVVLFPNGEDPDSFARTRPSSELAAFIKDNAKDFLVFKAGLLMADAGDDPVSKAAAIHEIVESIALVPDHVLRSLYLQQCSRLLLVNEQALISELNKVLRRAYKKKLGGDQGVPEEMLEPSAAPPQPEVEVLGTRPQEQDLLRMLLLYGDERVTVPLQDLETGLSSDEETSVAELIFQELAADGITFDDTILNAIYLDYRHAANLGNPMSPNSYASHSDDAWRSAAIDLLTEKHLLSINWTRHRIHVPHEKERLLDAVLEGMTILKERRVDRMIRDKQELLKGEISDDTLTNVMLEIQQLNELKKALAKHTGRVVVG
ncbi:MAG: DNA primase [Flavobacteriales bacterium]|nr:DNA primase [Flavobacteriales bacterium]MBK9286727.1 DNA primase [Flavobacteriales bacterium]MBL0035214.1 DNA primase [Flavobacteriales bacterium]